MAEDKFKLVKNLTTSEFKELLEVIRNIFAFAKFIHVIHPIRGKVRFELYPYQKSVLYHFLRDRFNIILKFRQAGITELISMYSLWLAMYHPNKNVQIISIKDRVAKKVLRKIKYMYKNLPDHIKVSIVNGRKGENGTATEIIFSNGSMITSVPTTEDAGRSEAVTLLVIDEAAIVRWASTIWKAAFPTLSTGGSAIVNSCITGDTMIIERSKDFRVDSICPKKKGHMNVEHLNLRVLSHTGKWQRVLGSVNKGILPTWEIEDEKGSKLKCTPDHKLLTPDGWVAVKDIINRDKYAIFNDLGVSEVEEPPVTHPPKEEVFKVIEDFPKYMILNLGKIYFFRDNQWQEKILQKNPQGYFRVSLHHNGKMKKLTLSRLMVETFMVEITGNDVVDHINCNINDNHINNLQILTRKENAQRAVRYSRSLAINTNTGKGSPNMQLVGLIRQLYIKYGHKPGYQDKIIRRVQRRMDITINRSYVTRIINGTRCKSIYISKIHILRKFMAPIYDISVEEDQSYITQSAHIHHNTPYGVGNWFHSIWVDSISGGNKFTPIRLFWQMHPERDQKWYDDMRDSLGARGCAQEVDGDFLSSGFSVFDLTDIKAIEDTLIDFKPIITRFSGNYRQFDKPVKDRQYFIGADVATGRSRDYSAFTNMDRAGEEASIYKGKIDVFKFADLLMEEGKKFNFATLAPETNDIGIAVTSKIQDAGYPNLYYSQVVLKKKRKRREYSEIPGWLTTSKNRDLIINDLEEDIRQDNTITKDPFFVSEAYTFIYNERNKPVALGKENRSSSSQQEDDTVFTDDAILGKAITNFIRKGRNKKGIIIPPT